MKPEMIEKCGVFAITGNDLDTASLKLGFETLQNRGEDAAGMVWMQNGEFVHLHRRGRIETLFEQQDFKTCPSLFLGHNRYATSGSNGMENTQPFLRSSGIFSLALADNGNLPEKELSPLRAELETQLPEGASDTAVMTSFLLENRKKHESWTETFLQSLPHFHGAFSLICATEERALYAARDPWGIRPLCLGRKNHSWVLASESSALAAMGADYFREVLPGELIRIDSEGEFQSYIYAAGVPEQRCLLESIYFSRNQSFDGQEIKNKRRNFGREAAKRFKQKGIPIDLVIPILNSGLEMTLGAAEELSTIHVEAIHVNGKKRSFIQNSPEERERTVHEKHIIDSAKIRGKRILLCDDSLVRGVSLSVLIKKIRALDHQPAEIHILLGSEPIVDICELGVDLASPDELLAGNLKNTSLEEIERLAAQRLQVDSVTYLDSHGIESAMGEAKESMCRSCFGGANPLNHREPIFRSDVQDDLRKQKIVFLASGNGTNVENLIQSMSEGRILAQPIGVISNQKKAGVIGRAQQHEIATTVISSKGRLKRAEARTQFESELLECILTNPKGLPDVVVLAGWMLVLSDNFLNSLAQADITVLNLHPALLSGKGVDHVATSRGMVPELRGANAIEQAFNLPISQMPITGVTVHEVKSGSTVDTGKIILKEEVLRVDNETRESLEAKIHESEYRVFPIALQKVLLDRLSRERTK